MKKRKKGLLLKDFLETNNLEEGGSFELEVALENVMDGSVGSSPLYHLDNQCFDVFQALPKQDGEKHLFRFSAFPKRHVELTKNQYEKIKKIIKEGNGVDCCIINDKDKLIEKKWYGNDCYLLNDIRNNSITLSSPQGFNDPMDPLVKAWIENKRIHSKGIDKNLYSLIEETWSRIRIGCLVDPLRNKRKCKRRIPRIEDCNPLMWAHYADHHKGLCIQYRIKPDDLINTDDIVLRLLDVNYDFPFPLDGNIPFVDSLIAKGDYWRYENETRLIMYSRKKVDYHYQLKNVGIEAVYMGWRIDKGKRDYLKSMLRGSDIKLFQMSFSTDDITKLVSHEIK